MQLWRRLKIKRENAFAALLLLCILATLPEPLSNQFNSANVLIIGVWVLVGVSACVAFFNPAWVGFVWFLTFAITLLAFLKVKLLYPLAMIILWGLWFWFRSGKNKGLS